MKRENPILNPLPEDALERGQAFALDVAYCAAEGLFQPYVNVMRSDIMLAPIGRRGDEAHIAKVEALEAQFSAKWDNHSPSIFLLETLGYMKKSGDSAYDVTEKAFALLEKPSSPPTVFISYKRGESSAFALLVEARLRLAGNPNPYLDKSLVVGEVWEKALEEHVRGAKYFILLVHPDAASSKYIKDEIRWAQESGCRILSIYYPGVNIETSGLEGLGQYQVINIKGNAASDYEDAVHKLLNALGYATY